MGGEGVGADSSFEEKKSNIHRTRRCLGGEEGDVCWCFDINSFCVDTNHLQYCEEDMCREGWPLGRGAAVCKAVI